MFSTAKRGNVFEHEFIGTVRAWLPYGPVFAFTSIKIAVIVPSFFPPIFTWTLIG